MVNIGRYRQITISPTTAPMTRTMIGLDRGGQGLGGAVDLPVIEVGNLVEHLTDLTAFFAHFDHLRDHLRENLVTTQCGRHGLSVPYGALYVTHRQVDHLVAGGLTDHGQ